MGSIESEELLLVLVGDIFNVHLWFLALRTECKHVASALRLVNAR